MKILANAGNNNLPPVVLFGKKMNFESPDKLGRYIYDPNLQKTEFYYLGDPSTGPKVGTKSLKTIATKKEDKKNRITHHDNKQKNEIDDSKNRD